MPREPGTPVSPKETILFPRAPAPCAPIAVLREGRQVLDRAAPEPAPARLVRVYRHRPRLYPERWKPAGPRRRRCTVCARALNCKTTRCLEGPTLVLTSERSAGALTPYERSAGQRICVSHLAYPGLRCTGLEGTCVALYYEAGPSYRNGVLVAQRSFVDGAGTPVEWCAWCWARLADQTPAGGEGSDA